MKSPTEWKQRDASIHVLLCSTSTKNTAMYFKRTVLLEDNVTSSGASSLSLSSCSEVAGGDAGSSFFDRRVDTMDILYDIVIVTFKYASKSS